MTRATSTAALGAMLLCSSARLASAQNLFEVEVFPDEVLERGETELEFHNGVMPSGTRLPDRMFDPSTHVHLSLEVTHGWTDAFETGLFIETAPAGGDLHATLTGWHVRPKFRFGQWRHVPVHLSVSAEYTFVKQAGDRHFRQAIAITPILERHGRRFEMSLNPAIEIAVRGPGVASSPVLEPSAKVASKLFETMWLGIEYYAETGSIRHFDPLSEQHHLIFPVVDFRTASGWELNVGVGRGLTGSSEHWVVKSIVGVRFRR
jgi:hypothetical protein